MNKKVFIGLVIGIVVVTGFILGLNDDKEKQAPVRAKAVNPDFVPHPNHQSETQIIERTHKLPAREKSVQSLAKLTKEFSVVVKEDFNSKNFKALLEKMNLTPDEKVMSNARRGKMRIIRTINNLPGTRYVHAQFFGEGSDQILQHLSFEYQKGEKSMQETIAEIKKSYPIKLDTEYTSEGFISWDIGEDHNLWIKKLTKSDMKNDPFNAYDFEQDEGTIRVAIELKIH